MLKKVEKNLAYGMKICYNKVSKPYNNHKRGDIIMAQGILPFKYVESKKSQSMTNFSGLFPYIELLHRMGFFEFVSRYVGVREGDQGWLDSQILLHLLLLNLSGGDCPEDIERLESDKGLCKAIMQLEKRLLGAKRSKEMHRRFRGRKGRKRCFASPNALRSYMEKFHNVKGEEDRVLGKAYIPRPNEYLEGLSWLNCEFLRFMQVNRGHRGLDRDVDVEGEGETATIDGDATLVASEKSEALYCYQNYLAYQPVNMYWDEYGLMAHTEFRDGNVPAGHEIKRVFCEALERLPEGVKKARFRGDSAAYQYELMDYCELGEDKRFGRIEFVISCDICDSFKRSVIKTGEEEWKPIYRDLGNGIKVKTNQQWAEVAYVGSLKSPEYRYIAIREPIEYQRSLPLSGIGDESQRCLPFPNYQDPGNGVRYELSGLVTNMEWEGEKLIHWSRKRCGKSEQAHSVMKSDLCGGKLPSGKFGANACWWQVMVLSLNLHEMFKRLCLPEQWHNRRLKSLRYWFIYVVGRIEKWGRQLHVILDKSQKAFEMYINARKRIATLASYPGG